MRRSQRGRHDEGQVTTALAMIVGLILVALGFSYVAKLAQVEDQAAGLQTAADAAALAGAQAIVRDMPDAIEGVMTSGRLLPGGLGSDAAASYASRNDATLVSYRYLPLADRVEVTVRSTRPLVTGGYEEATAWTRIGLRVGPCVLPAAPTPTPTPTVSPAPTPAPSPEPTPYDAVAVCGELRVPVTVRPRGNPTLRISPADLKSRFEPVLAG